MIVILDTDEVQRILHLGPSGPDVKRLCNSHEQMRQLLIDLQPAVEIARMAVRKSLDDYLYYCTLEARLNAAIDPAYAALQKGEDDD